MSEASISSAREKPSSRAFGFLGLLLIVQAVFTAHGALAAHETWRAAFYVIPFPLAVVIWVLHTRKCLRDLRLSGLWMILISLPMAFLVFSVFEGWGIVSFVALGVALVVQSLIAMRRPSQELVPSGAEIAGGPSK
jgi:hypothetical protein